MQYELLLGKGFDMEYNHIFGRNLIDLCDFMNVKTVPKSIRFTGDSVVIRMNAVCKAKNIRVLDSVPEGTTCYVNSYGYLHATADKRILASELGEHDFDAETNQFLEDIRKHFGLSESKYDSGTWIIIPEKTVVDKLAEFCEGDSMFAGLVCSTYGKGGLKSSYSRYICKVPLDADKVLLVMHEYPDAKYAPVLGYSRRSHQCEILIGCYFRKKNMTCLLGNSSVVCEYIGKYINDDETRVKVFREDEAIYPVVQELAKLADSPLDQAKRFFDLFLFVKANCIFTFEDVEAFLNNETGFICEKAKDIWDNEKKRQEVLKFVAEKF